MEEVWEEKGLVVEVVAGVVCGCRGQPGEVNGER